MTVGRRIWLLMAVALGLTGCRAAGTGSLSLYPRPGLSGKSFELEEFIAAHNRNAEGIQTLEARPSIGVAMGKHYPFPVGGRMALERPRNFKLELETHGVTKADIGSNEDEFWYWVATDDADNKWIYWCNYRDLESSGLAVTYQTDWIIEALGLRPITREEAALVQVRKGIEPGTTILSFPAVRNQGEPYSREMVVSNSDRRIKKLLIFSEKPHAPIAEAVPSNYQSYSGGAAAEPDEKTYILPQKLKLDWKREQLVLNVALQQVKLNQFDHARSAEMFIEPDMPGYTRRNLAELSRGTRSPRRTTTRETMPPPDSRDGIRLGRPAPMTDDDPVVPDVGRAIPQPAQEPGDSSLPTLNELVGAPVPRPPSSVATRTEMLPGSPTAGMSVER